MIETYYRPLLGNLRQSLENGRKMLVHMVLLQVYTAIALAT